MTLLPIIFSSLCTLLGALPILLIKNISHRSTDILLAFTVGIMIAASAYGLIPSAIRLSNLTVLVTGMLIGTLTLTILESLMPEVQVTDTSNKKSRARVILMFLLAMSLHNLPEGLSVGISNVNSKDPIGPLVAFAIGLQNIPDGFLVALFLVTQKLSRFRAICFAAITGMVEMCAGIIGVLFGGSFESVIPYGLAFAAGSMLFVVYKELIPGSYGNGSGRAGTIAFIVGFITMVMLTEWFR